MNECLIVEKPGVIKMQKVECLTVTNPNEVKIKSLVAGICGSDVSVYKGRLAHASYPIIPGHEVVGEVIEVGSNSNFNVGDKVVIVPNTFCDKCFNCLNGRRNICSNKISLGVNSQGIFQSEFIIQDRFVIPINSTIRLERAVLTEPLAVIVHALEKFSDCNKSDELLIIGCGSEGMLAVSLASYYGMNVSVCDINREKLKLVNQYLPNVKTYTPEEVEHLTFNMVLECAGVSASVEQAVRVVKVGGEIVLVGMPPKAELPIVNIVRNEINIQGSIIYNFPEDFEKSLNILSDENFVIDHAVVAPRTIDEFQSAYEDACSGKYGKILFKFIE